MTRTIDPEPNLNALQRSYCDGAAMAYRDVATKLRDMIKRAPEELKPMMEHFALFADTCNAKAREVYKKAERIAAESQHNYQLGYDDAFNRRPHFGPHHRDYFRGRDDGEQDRAARDEDEAGKRQECPHCRGTNTRRLTPTEHECFDCRGVW